MFDFSTFDFTTFDESIPATAVVRSVGGLFPARPRGKRWWEELLEEYAARYPQAEPSRAKRAVVARRQVKESVEEAISAGLLTEFNIEVVEVAAKAMTAPTVKEAMEYAARAQALIDGMFEEDEEEAILLLM